MRRVRNSPDARIEQWNLKYDPEYLKTLAEKAKSRWAANAEVAFNSLYETEVAVKQVLFEYPLPSNLVSSYLCFGREMWKAKQRQHGALLAADTMVKVEKWVSRKLEREILMKLATQVFDVAFDLLP
jgi:hypothetical protein